MRALAFLSFVLISLLWESGAYGRGSTQTWIPATTSAPSCTLDVVLVTFDDETAANPMTPESCRNDTCDYHEHDRPYGTNPGQDGRDRYTLRDFERLFNGGYDGLPDFVGDTVTVGNRQTNRDTLPEVFGSVRAYYDLMSNGAFQLRVRIINPADDQGYPRWVELPETKAEYARITSDKTRLKNRFWNEAYKAAWNEIQGWHPKLDAPKNVTCGASNLSEYDIKALPNADSDFFTASATAAI